MRDSDPTPAASRDRLEAAFRAAVYRVRLPSGEIEIVVGRAAPALDRLLARSGARRWAWLTAVNPGARRGGAVDNAARLARLDGELARRGLATWPGVCRDPSRRWPDEESRLVADLDAGQARALARELGQLAFLAGEAGGVARLEWVDQDAT
jgi:hypothetical protein